MNDELDLGRWGTAPATRLSDSIGEARMQIMKTTLAVTEMRLVYWMTAAFLVVGTIVALGAVGYGIAELTGRAPVETGMGASTLVCVGLAALPFILYFTISRLAVVSVLIASTRGQGAKLEAALAKAEAEAQAVHSTFTMAALWTADTQVALASGKDRDAAREALADAHTGISEKQVASIQFVEVRMDDDGEWTAVVDGG